MQIIKSNEQVNYPSALEFMKGRVEGIIAGHEPEILWFLEHPPLFTAGTSAKESDLLEKNFPVFDAGRGGQFRFLS